MWSCRAFYSCLFQIKIFTEGQLPHMHEALSSFPSIKKKKNLGKTQEGKNERIGPQINEHWRKDKAGSPTFKTQQTFGSTFP